MNISTSQDVKFKIAFLLFRFRTQTHANKRANRNENNIRSDGGDGSQTDIRTDTSNAQCLAMSCFCTILSHDVFVTEAKCAQVRVCAFHHCNDMRAYNVINATCVWWRFNFIWLTGFASAASLNLPILMSADDVWWHRLFANWNRMGEKRRKRNHAYKAILISTNTPTEAQSHFWRSARPKSRHILVTNWIFLADPLIVIW